MTPAPSTEFIPEMAPHEKGFPISIKKREGVVPVIGKNRKITAGDRRASAPPIETGGPRKVCERR